ncbi:MAG: hypothetical protein JWR70_3450 [Modestobacter sp.]|jgi:hypothetical protein|nr:hypothetical protein [Modestobacter sp.]
MSTSLSTSLRAPRRAPVLLAAVVLSALAGCSSGPAGERSVAATSSPGGASATVQPVAGTTAAAATTAAGTTAAGTTAADDAEPVATDPARPTATDVVLSYAAWDPGAGAVLAGGYLSPVIEDGGTCTLVLTKGRVTVTATSVGMADATTTACGDLRVPRSALSAGTWRAVLRYASSAADGESSSLSVAVPA